MLNVRGVGEWESRHVPLQEGLRGTQQTISLIRQLVEEGVTDPLVHRTARELLRGVAEYDEDAEARAIYYGVKRRVRYTRHMLGVGHGLQTLQPARVVLETGSGDCADINGILLPSLLGNIGFSTRLVTIKSDPSDPDEFSHVYLEADVNGQWVPLDAARPGADYGEAPPGEWPAAVWSLTGIGLSGVSKMLQGFGANLHAKSEGMRGGMRLGLRRGRGLGQDESGGAPTTGSDGGGGSGWLSTAGTIGETLAQEAPAILPGVASIVKAVNTPNLPTVNLGAGTATGVLTASGNSTLIILLLVGGAVLLLSRKS